MIVSGDPLTETDLSEDSLSEHTARSAHRETKEDRDKRKKKEREQDEKLEKKARKTEKEEPAREQRKKKRSKSRNGEKILVFFIETKSNKRPVDPPSVLVASFRVFVQVLVENVRFFFSD